MLTGGYVVAAGSVHHHDPFFAGGVAVEVLEADASPPDDFQIFGCFDELRGDFGAASNHPTIVVGDNFFELAGLEPDANVHLEARRALEYFQSLRSQRIGDENLHGLIQSLHQYFLSGSNAATERNLGAEFS